MRSKPVEQIRTAKPRTRAQGAPTASECQSDLGKTLKIAHHSAAPTRLADTFDSKVTPQENRGFFDKVKDLLG